MAALLWRCGSCGMRRKVLCSLNLSSTLHLDAARCYASASENSDESSEVVPSPSRKMEGSENTYSLKKNLGHLKKYVSIDTKKAYKPPDDARDRIRKILEAEISDGTLQSEWESTSLTDPKRKYMLLSKFIREFDHDVPNVILTDMTCVGDAVRYFETEVRGTSAYEDLASRRDLPPNLSIQLEPMRFNPETDTMFGGRTAFPGRDTIVQSIKYSRKYSEIKNTKEKPGYINYYYDY